MTWPRSRSSRTTSRSPLSSARVASGRSEEHTSELQSQPNLVCRLLLETKTTHERAAAYPAEQAARDHPEGDQLRLLPDVSRAREAGLPSRVHPDDVRPDIHVDLHGAAA